MNKKPLAYFLCVLTLALIAISPLIITSFFSEPQDSESFEGILEFWHITDWRTGGSSKAAFLARRIKEFEKNHPHVFVRMTKMSASEALGEINKGNVPDIISYPGSFSQNFRGEKPYMYGAYYILVNNELAEENGYFLPDGFGIDPQMLMDLCELNLVFDAEEGYSALPAIAMHEIPEPPRPNITTWPEKSEVDAALSLYPNEYFDGLNKFLDGEACVMIASQRQLFEAKLDYEQNNGPAFSYYAISGYTDMVQYICAMESEDRLRTKMCNAFAEYLLSERAQSKLYPLCVFPVVSGIKIYEDDEVNVKIYELLINKPAIVSPDNQETLTDLSLRSFAGDKASLRELRKLLE